MENNEDLWLLMEEFEKKSNKIQNLEGRVGLEVGIDMYRGDNSCPWVVYVSC